MFKHFIKKRLSDEFFLNRTIFFALIFLAGLAAIVMYDNPSVFSALLFTFCIFLILQTYFFSKVYKTSAGLKVHDIMIPRERLITLNHSMNTAKVLDVITKSFQEIFPVFYNDNFFGIIIKDKFLNALSSGYQDAYVSDYTEKNYEFVYDDENIQKTLSNGRLKSSGMMVVFDRANSFCGILSYEKLVEYLLVNRALKESKNREVQDEFFL